MPSIILRSQFTVPNAHSFSAYVDYMFRREALEEKAKAGHLTDSEQDELNKISNAIDSYEMMPGQTYKSSPRARDKIEKEADKILDGKDDYTKYLSYMSREYALKKKEKLSPAEEKELHMVHKKLAGYSENQEEEKALQSNLGLFSIDKETMTVEDMLDARERIQAAQSNGSVLYQDVISFDMDFLIKRSLYDPETEQLDESRLRQAGIKMMEQMFKDESIPSGYWFAAIHRNTEHVHIHFATVESRNTRQIRNVKRDGIPCREPQGKRKQPTIDAMKSKFATTLTDRTSQLTRISDLRNTLYQSVKEAYSMNKEQLEEAELLGDIYSGLPENKKDWRYAVVPASTREKIDRLTDSLMSDNPDYIEYVSLVEAEGRYRKKLYGESKREDKDYAENQKKDIKARLGNSLLKELKQDVNKMEYVRKAYSKKSGVAESNPKGRSRKPAFSKYNLYHLKRALNDDYEKWRAEKDYERMQERIAFAQEAEKML